MSRQVLAATTLSRRGFLAASVLGGAALVACNRSATAPNGAGTTDPIAAAEAARPHTGKTVTARLAPVRPTSTSAERGRRLWPTTTRFRAR